MIRKTIFLLLFIFPISAISGVHPINSWELGVAPFNEVQTIIVVPKKDELLFSIGALPKTVGIKPLNKMNNFLNTIIPNKFMPQGIKEGESIMIMPVALVLESIDSNTIERIIGIPVSRVSSFKKNPDWLKEFKLKISKNFNGDVKFLNSKESKESISRAHNKWKIKFQAYLKQNADSTK